MNQNSNLLITGADQNIRDVFAVTFELYKLAELNKNLFKYKQDKELPKKLIELYYTEIKPDYNSIIYNFKRKYIINEALVEKNNTKLEKSGIGLMYDYIQEFKPDTDYFNIFVTGLKLHQLLYKPLDDANKVNIDKEYIETQKLVETAKQEKDLVKYKAAKEKLKELSISTVTFGGQLRSDDNDVRLKDVDIKIPSSIEAKKYFNSFASVEKVVEYQNSLVGANICNYIDYCVNTVAKLIKMQPFSDGNKRTFRGLLNLMFKNKNIPPVYITSHERKEYKEALIKAIVDEDYKDLDYFYYYKICDSIYELDVKPYIENRQKGINQK